MAARRVAWLLDIGFGTLRGSARSAALMAECLAAHGFETHTLSGPEVTRARVKRLLCALHDELHAGDAFVLYFVGHGDKIQGTLGPLRSGGPRAEDEILFLITYDIFVDGETTPAIAGPELSKWLSPLADKIGNVTVILDCCRAATMVPGKAPVDAEAVAHHEVILHRAAAALRAKYRGGPEGVTRGDRSETSIVRLVATTRNETAIERKESDGWTGLFTAALSQVLMQRRPYGGEERSWDQLLPELQEIVLAGCPTQRPGVEGPRHRLPFSLRERRDLDEYPCCLTAGRWIVDAGALHGIEVGDHFDLGPQGALAERVEPHCSYLRVTARPPAPAPRRTRRSLCGRRDTIAWCSEQTLPPNPPGLQFLRGEHAGAIATVEDRVAGPVLCDPTGDVIHAGASGLLEAACRLARWCRQAPVLEALASDKLLHVTWGREGSTAVLPRAGAELPAEAGIWVRASGTGERAEVFVSLFRLQADRHLVHLSDDLDHGISVSRNGSVDLIQGPGILPLHWSPQVPADRPRDEALILLVSTHPRSFHRVGTTPTIPRKAIEPRVRRSASAPVDFAVVNLAYRLCGR
jgi:hypothetical protein